MSGLVKNYLLEEGARESRIGSRRQDGSYHDSSCIFILEKVPQLFERVIIFWFLLLCCLFIVSSIPSFFLSLSFLSIFEQRFCLELLQTCSYFVRLHFIIFVFICFICFLLLFVRFRLFVFFCNLFWFWTWWLFQLFCCLADLLYFLCLLTNQFL